MEGWVGAGPGWKVGWELDRDGRLGGSWAGMEGWVGAEGIGAAVGAWEVAMGRVM